MTSPDKREEPAQYEADVAEICETYRQAQELHEAGAHVVCVDEKTGIQAKERKHPTKTTQPGLIERIEFEYIRHGTQCLIANFEVATGEVITPTVSQTRTEADFLAHIERTIDTDPEACWVFVVDQLNTHKSPSLVRMVAQRCGLQIDLGQVGRRGDVLENMKSRKKFLCDPSHRIRFVYTPRHCSWLNQIEIWFSILVRRLLKRSSFTSITDLKARLLTFIEYFNVVLAKPFKWTYRGKLLHGAD